MNLTNSNHIEPLKLESTLKKIRSKIYNVSKNLGNKLGIDLPYYVENGFWVLSGQVSNLILGLLLSVLLTRYTTKAIYGQYSFLFSIFSLTLIVALPGISNVIFRAIVANKEKTYTLAVKYSLKLGLLGSIILIFLGVYNIYILKYSLGISLLIAATIFPFYYPASMWSNLLTAKEKFSLVAKYGVIVTLVNFLAISSVLLIGDNNLIYFFTASLLSTTGVNIFFFFKTKKYVTNTQVEVGWKKSAFKLTLPVIFTHFYSYADKVVLMFFLGEEALAIYTIAIIPGDKASSFLSSGIRLISPRLYQAESKEVIKLIKKKIIPFLFISLALVGVGSFFVPLFMKLYPKSYSESIFLAQIYLLILPLYVMTAILGNVLIKDKKESFFTLTIIISSVINLIAYFVLIPKMGILGGVIGSILYFAIQVILRLYYIFRNHS